MLNYYYKDAIELFLTKSSDEIIGSISRQNQFDSNQLQSGAWEAQISILKEALVGLSGTIFFEFSIPRMGKRVDSIIIINGIVFVVEFKIGETRYLNIDIEQVWDYALDLKNFHKPSHTVILIPILVTSEGEDKIINLNVDSTEDNVINPIKANRHTIRAVIRDAIKNFKSQSIIDGDSYAKGDYAPTPTIIEAAISLYNNHSVDDITRNDANAINLKKTTQAISNYILIAKESHQKLICFVTGVPGAGKTLVGLKIATEQLGVEKEGKSVYLSGNAPLVSVLQEALSRDRVKRASEQGMKITKASVKRAVKSFIQIIHHYRDEYIVKPEAPYDHIAIFDEAQRAWNKEQTVNSCFRKRSKVIFTFRSPSS